MNIEGLLQKPSKVVLFLKYVQRRILDNMSKCLEKPILGIDYQYLLKIDFDYLVDNHT